MHCRLKHLLSGVATKGQPRSGQASVQVLGLLLISMAVGALSVDAGLFYAHHQGMQNAADAAAHAAASELFKYTPAVNGSALSTIQLRMQSARAKARTLSESNQDMAIDDADIDFGYINPATGAYDPSTFETPTNNAAFAQTAGYNAVRVTVRAERGGLNSPVPALFAKFLGAQDFNSYAQAIAIYGGSVSGMTGLRPLYVCQAGYDQAVALFGDASKPTVRFYGDTLTVGGTDVDQASSCGALGPGNWGLADFDGGGGGSKQLGEVMRDGYDGVVNVGEWYGPKPGNAINANGVETALEKLKNNGTVIAIPLYSQTTGNGKNAQFKISSIQGFVITKYKAQGNDSYVEGHFVKGYCHAGCSISNSSGGGTLTRLRLIR